MLNWLRKRRNLQTLVLGGLAVLFILWGVGGTLGTRQASYAGRIFGRKVPARAFIAQEQMVARAWHAFNPDTPLDPQQLEQQTWTRLALLDEARRRQIRVTDADVVAAIEAHPFFQRDGRFDPERYQRYVQFQRLAPRQFEEAIRQDLLLDQLRAEVTQGAVVDELALRQTFDEERLRVHVRVVTVPWAACERDAMRALTAAERSGPDRARLISERSRSLAEARAKQVREELVRAGADQKQRDAVLRRQRLRIADAPAVTKTGGFPGDVMEAARVQDAARSLNPNAWSMPLEGKSAWVLVQLVALLPPNDADWQREREAIVQQRAASAGDGAWRAYLEDVLRRANVSSYLR